MRSESLVTSPRSRHLDQRHRTANAFFLIFLLVEVICGCGGTGGTPSQTPPSGARQG